MNGGRKRVKERKEKKSNSNKITTIRPTDRPTKGDREAAAPQNVYQQATHNNNKIVHNIEKKCVHEVSARASERANIFNGLIEPSRI